MNSQSSTYLKTIFESDPLNKPSANLISSVLCACCPIVYRIHTVPGAIFIPSLQVRAPLSITAQALGIYSARSTRIYSRADIAGAFGRAREAAPPAAYVLPARSREQQQPTQKPCVHAPPNQYENLTRGRGQRANEKQRERERKREKSRRERDRTRGKRKREREIRARAEVASRKLIISRSREAQRDTHIYRHISIYIRAGVHIYIYRDRKTTGAERASLKNFFFRVFKSITRGNVRNPPCCSHKALSLSRAIERDFLFLSRGHARNCSLFTK